VSKETCTVKGCGHLKTDHAGGKVCQRKQCRCTRYEGQDAENQLLELRRYAKAQKWQAVEYIDYETGKHSDRDAFRALFEDASRKKFDVVLVWALDRFSREGILSTLQHLKRLKDYGVQFESYRESWARTTGPLGGMFVELMTAITAWAAQEERLRISERTKAGLARARSQGRVGGRRATVFSRDRAEKLRKSGMSWRAIARKMGVAQSTIRDGLTRVRET
jgi:DNA invertase Pin-like site-specific DNA recombinase